jgi:hypothetical protein
MMRRSTIWFAALSIVLLAGCQYLVDSTAPDVAITDPFGTSVAEGEVTISATVSDFDSGLKSARILVGGNVALVENYPRDADGRYQTTTDTVSRTIAELAPGDYTITVEAVNGFDLTGSASRTITVTEVEDQDPPVVEAWLGPKDGDTVNGTVALAVAASDDTGVVRVDFYAGTTLLGTDDTAPYTLDWDTTDPTLGIPDGPVTLAARAFDAASRIGRSSIEVEVLNAVAPPTLGLLQPADGAEVSSRFTVIADVTNDGEEYTWVPEDSGNLWARIYDQFGNLVVEAYMTSDGTNSGAEPGDNESVTVERDFNLDSFLGESPLDGFLVIVEGTVSVDGNNVRIARQAEFDVAPTTPTAPTEP